MASIRPMMLVMFCLIVACHVVGCRSGPPEERETIDSLRANAEKTLRGNQIEVLVLRNANFAGGGRIHLFSIDKKVIGTLTADNHFRLLMWPGEYEFTITLAREDFLGQVLPPLTISRQVILARRFSGRVLICSYTDGAATGGFSLTPGTTAPPQIKRRVLANTLNARQTAQVTGLFSARYDGPAINGRAHGEGMLRWSDGSVYIGRVVHGLPSGRARFFFPDGRVYMGGYYRGRPAGKGILMSPEGRILFVGRFSDEKPHGSGLRFGRDGPEYCLFDHGSDRTKTFRQQAIETVGREDERSILEFSDRTEEDDAANRGELIRQLESSRKRRVAAKEVSIRENHRMAIEKRRRDCREMFARGLTPCACAPFADDYLQWSECSGP